MTSNVKQILLLAGALVGVGIVLSSEAFSQPLRTVAFFVGFVVFFLCLSGFRRARGRLFETEKQRARRGFGRRKP